MAIRPRVTAQPTPEGLPPFRLVAPDRVFSTWEHHVRRAVEQRIHLLGIASPRPGAALATVNGSQGDAYRVRVRPAVEPGWFEASCSCPAGRRGEHWCKHVAFVLVRLGILPEYLERSGAAIWEEVEKALLANTPQAELQDELQADAADAMVEALRAAASASA